MAVRPIDANAMLNELRPVSFESEHSAMLLSDVLKMMREWVERQPTLTPPNEWVSVEERLPEESDGIVLLTNGKIVISGYRNQLFGLNGEQGVFAPSIKRGGGYMQVTYWMLLPAPPNCRPPEGRMIKED